MRIIIGMDSAGELQGEIKLGYMGIGWQLNNIPSHYSHLEKYEIQEAQILKKLRPDLKVSVLRNTEVATVFWDSAKEKMYDPATQVRIRGVKNVFSSSPLPYIMRSDHLPTAQAARDRRKRKVENKVRRFTHNTGLVDSVPGQEEPRQDGALCRIVGQPRRQHRQVLVQLFQPGAGGLVGERLHRVRTNQTLTPVPF